jgi:hypothetical protein
MKEQKCHASESRFLPWVSAPLANAMGVSDNVLALAQFLSVSD